MRLLLVDDVLLYAKQCADKNPGYAVFNETGEQIYCG